MSKLVIGIDPDSVKHGVAFYSEGKLTSLESMDLIKLYEWIKGCPFSASEVEIHLEDVCAVSSSSFHYKARESLAVKSKKSENVGQCKQAQIEVERMAEHLGVKVVKHKISKKWKCTKIGKPEFERVTGWIGRSNEDNRSAAYFGFLGCK
jgi:hypothetical protein